MRRATSIEDQIAVARDYAEQNKLQVVDDQIYRDEALSGASLEGRPGVQALVKATASTPRPFDVVLVDDSSRVARDLPEALMFMRLPRFHGVQVLYLSQQIDSANEQAETLMTVHGLVDGLYLREMAAKIKRGLAGQLERRFATGARTYGYTTTAVPDPSGKRDPKGNPSILGHRIEIDPVRAAVVRTIFERYVAGVGIGTLTEELNRTEAPAPRGSRWRYIAVRHILRNERYTGLQIWGQRTFQRRPGSRQKVARPQKRKDWRIGERPDLRTVSNEVWERVQARLAQVAATARRQQGSNLLRGRNPEHHARHLFTGVMRCGVCGGPMATVCGGHGSPRYGCRSSWRHGRSTCANRMSVRARVVDPLLLSALQAQLTSPEVVTYLTEAVSVQVAAVLDEGPRRRERLEDERAKVQRKLQHLVVAVENGAATPSMLSAIRDREADLDRIDRELDLEPERLEEKLVVLPSWVQRQLADVAGLLQDEPERVRAHFRRIGLSFTVSPVVDEGRPFLRAVGTADVMKATFDREFDFPATGRSLPRSAPRSRLRGRSRPLY